MKNKNKIDIGLKGFFQKRTEIPKFEKRTTLVTTEPNTPISPLRSIFSVLSLRGNHKKEKKINTASLLQSNPNQQPISIDSNILEKFSYDSSFDQSVKQTKQRAKILTPDEELLFPLIRIINTHPQLKDILNKIRFSELYDQIKLIQNFPNGALINHIENIDFIEIITKIGLSLNTIIKDLNIPEDQCISLKNLALNSSLYLFKHDLWNEFMPIEMDYAMIKEEEGHYEDMNLEESTKKEEVIYMNMSSAGKLDFCSQYRS